MYVNPNLYSRYASTGAFTDLTDLFPEYMPETYALFSEDELQQAPGGRSPICHPLL